MTVPNLPRVIPQGAHILPRLRDPLFYAVGRNSICH